MSDEAFCITHSAPNCFEVKRWMPSFWLFGKGYWQFLEEFKTKKQALEYISRRSQFRACTSFYDKHGNECIEQTDW